MFNSNKEEIIMKPIYYFAVSMAAFILVVLPTMCGIIEQSAHILWACAFIEVNVLLSIYSLYIELKNQTLWEQDQE
jgi:hypothetical protein